MNQKPVVKLKLAVSGFDETPYLPLFALCERSGIEFESMLSLGDTGEQHRALYALNKTCSSDIPNRGEFFTFEEFVERRFGAHYDPRGVIVARHGEQWIGMTAISNWQENGFGFNEMTGVIRAYRRQGIAMALKVLGVLYAQHLSLSTLYTLHDADNTAAIAMNRKLGYVDADWEMLSDIWH